MLVLITVTTVAAIACGGLTPPPGASASVGKAFKPSVTGTMTYQVASTTPDSILEIYLVSISKAGTPSIAIGKQVIKSPAHGSQSFKVEYSPEDVDEGTRYAIQGMLIEGDELVAINTVVYPVLTRGGYDYVGSLVLDLVGQSPLGPSVPVRRGWSDVPAHVESVSVTETYKEYSIRVVSYLPNGCYKFKGSDMRRRPRSLRELYSIDSRDLTARELVDAISRQSPDIMVTVTNLMSTLPVGCTVGVNFVETQIPLRAQDLRPGETYNIFVNEELATTFTAR